MPHFKGKDVYADAFVSDAQDPIKITSQAIIVNLNADMLDGEHGTFYRNAANLTGILSPTAFNDTTHGNRSGGTLHATCTETQPGFMSANDKLKLDSITPGAGVNQNSYSVITDGVNSAIAQVATDTIKFRSSDTNYLTITVGSNDPTHGDNVLFSFNIGSFVQIVGNNLSHNQLLGLTADDHPQYAKTDGSRAITGAQIFNDGITTNGLNTNILTDNVFVKAKELIINTAEAGAGVTGTGISGIRIKRGSEPDALFYWNENDDSFYIGVTGNVIRLDPSSFGSGGGLAYRRISTDANLLKNEYVFVDTSQHPVTLYLPTVASFGDILYVSDLKRTFGINKAMIAPAKIEGVTDTYDFDISGKEYKLMYVDSTFGWRIL